MQAGSVATDSRIGHQAAGSFVVLSARWVRALRGGLSQAELSRRSGIPQSTISALEAGQRAVLPYHVDAIIEAAGLTLPVALRLLLILSDSL